MLPQGNTDFQIIGGDPADAPGDTLKITGDVSFDSTTGGISGFDLSGIEGVEFENAQISGSNASDTITLSADPSGGRLLKLNDLTPIPVSGDGPIVIDGGDQDDKLIVDFSNGNPFPSGGVTFNGGGGNDSIQIDGGSFTDVNYQFDTENDGNVDFGGSLLTYTGLEPIIDNSNAANRIFTFTGGAETITLSDDGMSNNMSMIDSTLGESVVFVNPTNSLTINAGTGADTIDLAGIEGTIPSLIVNGDAEGDTINGGAIASGVFTNVTLNGNAGNDEINGTQGIDTINGGADNDTITGGQGADIQNGDAGMDTFVWNNGDGPDDNSGGADDDIFVFNGSDTDGDNVRLVPAADVGEAGDGTLTGAEFDLTRTAPSAFTIEGKEIETIELNTLGGADEVLVTLTGFNVDVDGGDPTFDPGDSIGIDAGGENASFDGTTLTVDSITTNGFEEIELSKVREIDYVGDGGNDNVTLSATASPAVTAELNVGSGRTITFDPSITSLVNFDGGGGNDTFTYDATNRVPGPSVTFDGQAGNDDLIILGQFNRQEITHTAPGTDGNSGQVNLDGETITFTGLEPITAGNSVDTIVNFNTGSSNNATLRGGSAVGTIEIVDNGTTFEDTELPNPERSLTIHLGGDGDELSVETLDRGFAASLIVNGGTGTDDVQLDAVTLDTAGAGRGLHVADVETLGITNSSITNNQTIGNGAGVLIEGGTATITNSTISGNQAVDGGGIFFDDADVTINNSTVAGNTAGVSGGIGLDPTSTTTLLTLNSTIVAGNVGTNPDFLAPSTPATNLQVDNSLIGDNTGTTLTASATADADGNLIGSSGNPIDPLLGPLQFNGGPTRTHALSPQSPAIDGGAANGLTTDQRGSSRTVDTAGTSGPADETDIGAFELGQQLVVNVFDSDVNDGNPNNDMTTLREAIDIANASGSFDVISFANGGTPRTIELSSQLPTITGDVTITGPGAEMLTLDAGHGTDDSPGTGDGFRLFNIDDGDNNNQINVRLSGLTLTGGDQNTGTGGAIRNWENLTISGTTVRGNSTMPNNSAGGGIHNRGDLTVSGSTIIGNSTSGFFARGGGISSVNGNLTVTDSTISGNSTSGSSADGGGIYSLNGNLAVTDSTISGNSTSGSGADGGGIYSNTNLTDQTTRIIRSTLSGNSTAGRGGGLFNADGLTVIESSTITNNTAPSGNGGGIASYGDSATTTEITGSIIAGNNGEDVAVTNGTTNSFVSGGHNLIGGGADFDSGSQNSLDNFTQTGDQTGVADPMLGPLASNGGPTETHALLAGSPAIDAGDPAITNGFDQRGAPFVRVFDDPDATGNGADIGSLERQTIDPSFFIVTTTVDELDYSNTDVSLREAIDSANGSVGADTITFASPLFDTPQTINLTSQLPTIIDALTITGPGAELLTLDAGNGTDNNAGTGDGFRISNIDDGDDTSQFNVILSGLSLTGGDPNSGDNSGVGGAIRSRENLTVSDSMISGNSTFAEGGGIYSYRGDLTVSGSTISGNSTSGNFAHGGGIYSRAGDLTVTGSTISGNSTSGVAAHGGGIYNFGGDLTVTGSTISGNSTSGSDADGGGIYSDTNLTDQTMRIIRSTISGNSTAGRGGGFFNFDGRTVIESSTITDNTAPTGYGGGVASYGDNATSTEITGSIIAGNNGEDVAVTGGTTNSFVSGGHNLIGSGADFDSGTQNALDNFTQTGDQTGVDPMLGPLASNGGPTETHALLMGSPAIDAGDPAITNGFDQRGAPFVRVFDDPVATGNAADIGSYERQSFSLVVDTTADVDDGDLSAGNLSLREAIGLANANPGTDTITFASPLFDSPQTISLAGELVLSDAVTITGPGADQLTIDANGNSRIFRVDDASSSTIDVQISGLNLTRGRADNGGAILNHEELTLTDTSLTGNAAAFGGAVDNLGELTIVRSTISGNMADGGAGVQNQAGGILTVSNSTISGNIGTGYGAGLLNLGQATIESSTIVDNHSNTDGGSFGDGGGIRTSSAGVTSLQNTIVAGNFTGAAGSEVADDIAGVALLASSQNNLIGDPNSAGGLTEGTMGNLVGDGSGALLPLSQILNPVLADNGGTTLTHNLIPDSRALDAGAASALPATDQTGNPRVNDLPFVANAAGENGLDIGSVELADSTPPVITPPADITIEGDTTGGLLRASIQSFLDGATATDDLNPMPVISNNAQAVLPLGTTTITFTADDGSNTSTATATVTVTDTTAPTLNVPVDISVEGDTTGGADPTTEAIVAFLAAATATDIVDDTLTINHDLMVSQLPLGDTVVTFSVTDSSGNMTTDTATITVVDTTAPVIVAPPDISVEGDTTGGADPMNAAILAFLAGATVSDMVDGELTITNDAPDLFEIGDSVVTFTSTDDSGNTGTTMATVTVTDTTSPMLTVPDDISVEGDTTGGADATGTAIAAFLAGATATDTVDDDVAIAHDGPMVFPVGATTVTFTAVDDAGNETTGSAIVTVTDTTAPMLTIPDDISVEGDATGGAEATNEAIVSFLAGAAATDIVDDDVTISNDAPALFAVGSTVVTFTATDDAGNQTEATAMVVVTDSTAPTLVVPDDVTVEGDTTGGALASNMMIVDFLAAAMASDIVDDDVTVTNDAPNLFPIGETIVTFTATDSEENETSLAATVTVADTTAPTLNAPNDTSVQGDTIGGAELTGAMVAAFLAGANAADVVDDDAAITNDAPDVLPLGDTVVTFTATDDAGNEVMETATITVVDSTAPVVRPPEDATVEGNIIGGADDTNAAITAFLAGVSAVDQVDAMPTITHNAPTLFPLGDTVVTFTATDASGNTNTGSATVTVVDTIAPALGRPANITVEADATGGSTSSNAEIAAYLDGATASDLVDLNPTLTNDAPTNFPVGATTVTFTGSDASGNTRTVLGIITVVDTTAPVLTVPNNITVDTNVAGGAEATLPALAAFLSGATATDIADASPTITHDGPAVFPVGDTTVTFRAADSSGNQVSDTAVVTVNQSNVTPPAISVSISPGGPGGVGDPDDLPSGEQPTSWAQQRSEFRQIVITFETPISVPSAADLVLTNLGVNAPVDPDTVIQLQDSQLSLSSDGMTLTIEFDAGQLTDGVYQLELQSAITGGAPFIFTGSAENRFFVLTGDWNGTGGVNIQDFSTFAYWFGNEVPTAPHYVDVNNSGGINIQDFSGFSANFATSVVFPSGGGSGEDTSGGEGELISAMRTLVDPTDVNGDTLLSGRDAVNVINEVDRRANEGDFAVDGWSRYDVNRDGMISLADAIKVINELDAADGVAVLDSVTQTAEGEQVFDPVSTIAESNVKAADCIPGDHDVDVAFVDNASASESDDEDQAMTLEDAIDLLAKER